MARFGNDESRVGVPSVGMQVEGWKCCCLGTGNLAFMFYYGRNFSGGVSVVWICCSPCLANVDTLWSRYLFNRFQFVEHQAVLLLLSSITYPRPICFIDAKID